MSNPREPYGRLVVKLHCLFMLIGDNTTTHVVLSRRDDSRCELVLLNKTTFCVFSFLRAATSFCFPFSGETVVKHKVFCLHFKGLRAATEWVHDEFTLLELKHVFVLGFCSCVVVLRMVYGGRPKPIAERFHSAALGWFNCLDIRSTTVGPRYRKSFPRM